MQRRLARVHVFLIGVTVLVISGALLLRAAYAQQPPAASILVGPFLEAAIADDETGTSSIRIIWETPLNASAQAEVRYGLSADALDLTAVGTSTEFGGGATQLHTAQLRDLQPFTRYYYQVRSGPADADFSPVLSFMSAPLANSEQSFTIVGTSDEQPGQLNPTYNRVLFRHINENLIVPEVCGTADDCAEAVQVLLTLGDNADVGAYDEYAPWFAARQVLQGRVQTIGAAGNHDYDAAGTAVNYYTYHHYPENASFTALGLPEDPEFDPAYLERWYFQDYSNVRFIVLDSNLLSGDPTTGLTALMQRWLAALLENTCTAEHIDFVMLLLHHNSEFDEIWSVGFKPNTELLVDQVERFASDCGRPTFYFYGHAHNYNRGHDSDHNHTFMNIAVAGGSIDAWPMYAFAQDFAPVIASDASFGYVRIDVTAGDTPSVRLRRYSAGYTPNPATAPQGLIDDFTITRSSHHPDAPQASEAVIRAIETTGAVILRGSAYSDPDGVPMMSSRWQVTTSSGDYESPVFDHLEHYRNWYRGVELQAGDDITETEFRNFAPNTTYYWRVRYRNQHGHWSDWSPEASFTVGDAAPFFRTARDSYRPGEGVQVLWSGLPGNERDWVAIAAAGSPDDQWVGANYHYTRGIVGGSHTFYGLPIGDYEARVYYNWPDGGYVVQARHPFTVEGDIAVALTTDRDRYMPGETIAVTWTNLPGGLDDYIVLLPQGGDPIRRPDGLSTGTNGAYNGYFYITAPEIGGTYEVRAYAGGGAAPLAVRAITIAGAAQPTALPTESAEAGSCLLVEDFEGLPLNPALGESIDPSVLGWTHTPPAGWTVTNREGMAEGMPEWQGWSFTTMPFWNSADQQDRINFTRASGVFAVADPDEWDDRNNPAAVSTFDSVLSTPIIDVRGVNTVTLRFDSHYRQEAPQVARVTASFDGGEPIEILRYDADSADDIAQQNQAIALEIPVPAGAAELVLTWDLIEAGNNWYWAIDNIHVTADVLLDRETLCDRPRPEVTPIPTPNLATPTPAPTVTPAANVEPIDPATVLFAEDFNDFTLKPAVDEDVGPILGWNTDSQGGWTIVVPETVPQGTTEWQGWSATTMPFWNATDPQDRILFTRAEGIFMVADPDEWDDYHIGASQGGIYETSLISPAIDVNGVSRIRIAFDSHYWQEDTQQATLTAVFDSGDSVELLAYGPGSAGEEKNLHLVFEAPVPAGAASVQLVFRMFNATNDWYWAIDNILVTAAPAVVTVPLPYREDFDALAGSLQPAVDEAIDPAVLGWTHTPPAGWTVTTPDTVPQGTTEWQGWSFTTMPFWTSADQQERGAFTKAFGVFAVADPDEWDDFNAGTTDEMDYNTFLTSPALAVTGVARVFITFDSHWRPEDHQVAVLTATFDTGEQVELLRYDSVTTADDGSNLNETVDVSVIVPPGAATMTLTWSMLTAGNDWFWAIDNVRVVGG